MKKGRVDYGFEHKRFSPLHVVPLPATERQELEASGFTHGYKDCVGEFLVKQGEGRAMRVLRKIRTREKDVWVQIFPRIKRKKKCKGCKNCKCNKTKEVLQHADR